MKTKGKIVVEQIRNTIDSAKVYRVVQLVNCTDYDIGATLREYHVDARVKEGFTVVIKGEK